MRQVLGELSWQSLGWGASFVDLNLDGWKDLVIANGHVYPEVDCYEIGTSYHQKNFLFRNLANGRFEEVSGSAGPDFQKRYANRGLAGGDIDNNGQVDLLIANLDREPSLLTNEGSFGNWLILRLESRLSNRSAIGARRLGANQATGADGRGEEWGGTISRRATFACTLDRQLANGWAT